MEKKLAILKKKVNNEIVYNKKYIRTESTINTKEIFQCFYIPVTLLNLVNRKDENYYPKVFLEKYNFNKDIEIYSNNFYLVNSDEEYHDEK